MKHENGLSHSHAYTVVGVKTLSTGDKLVKMRNPWGSEGFKGEWSDNSDKWTPALKEEVNLTKDMQDGYFYISINDVHKQCDMLWINYDNTNWQNDYFLMLDDPMTEKEPGSRCTGKCSSHKINITSEVDQTIHVSLHTWDKRAQPPSCLSYANSHSFSSTKL